MIGTELISVISDFGVIGLLVVIIATGFRRYWVFGWVYDQVRAERDEWKAMALEGCDLAERAVTPARRGV